MHAEYLEPTLTVLDPQFCRDGSAPPGYPCGSVMLVGGHYGANVPGKPRCRDLRAAEIYDPSSGRWSCVGEMNTPRLRDHTATLLRDGKVLVVGGECVPGFCDPQDDADAGVACRDQCFTASVEVYDPVSKKWDMDGILKDGNDRPVPHISHTATLLSDGRVLVTGGRDAAGQYGVSGTTLDPISGVWIRSPGGGWNDGRDLSVGRFNHTATLLTDGRVMVAGGAGGLAGASGRVAETELFDRTDNWVFGGRMVNPREDHTATLLPDGRVMVAGGSAQIGDPTPEAPTRPPNLNPSSTVEIYQPVTGVWSLNCSMRQSRNRHSASLLPDGRVLLAGGSSLKLDDPGTTISPNMAPYNLDSAELFAPGVGSMKTLPLNEARSEHAAVLVSRPECGAGAGCPPETLVAGGQGCSEGTSGPCQGLRTAELYPVAAAAPQTGALCVVPDLNLPAVPPLPRFPQSSPDSDRTPQQGGGGQSGTLPKDSTVPGTGGVTQRPASGPPVRPPLTITSAAEAPATSEAPGAAEAAGPAEVAALSQAPGAALQPIPVAQSFPSGAGSPAPGALGEGAAMAWMETERSAEGGESGSSAFAGGRPQARETAGLAASSGGGSGDSELLFAMLTGAALLGCCIAAEAASQPGPRPGRAFGLGRSGPSCSI